MQHRRQPAAGGVGGPAGGLFGGIEHRDQVMGGEITFAAWPRPVEDHDLGPGQQRTQCQSFVDGGDEKTPAAGRQQGRRNGGGAQTIGIGLDHRGGPAAVPEARRQLPPVAGNGRQIHRQPGAGAGFAGITRH